MSVDFSKDLILRQDTPEPALAPLLQEAGITTVRSSELGDAVLKEGMWPGIARPASVAGRGDETASASRQPWVDSNGYWIRYERTLHPNRPAVLAYTAADLGDRGVPFDSLELALAEAWTAGGNYVMSLEPNFRTGLLKRDAKALAAWKHLGQTGRWLRENAALFQRPVVPIATVLVEPGEETPELANLMYRLNASPALALAATPPRPDPQSRSIIVAANLEKVTAPAAILAHAEAGATVVVTGDWWKKGVGKLIKSETDREYYSAGKGRVVGYKAPISDPSEFALDVIDLVTHKKRAVRLWNAPAVIAVATDSPRKGGRLVHLVNYGSAIDSDVQLRVQGKYRKATLMRPEGTPVDLPASGRGSMTEVQVPELRRVATLAFD